MGREDAGFVAGRYELFLALRYLKARRKQAFTSIVSAVSILGIAIGVAALVIALALLTGFQQDIQAKIIGANAHIVIWGTGEAPLANHPEVVATAREAPGVVGAAAVVMQQALINTNYRPAFANFKGVDPEAGTTQLLDRIVEGSAAELRQRDRDDGVIIGQDMAANLLLQVGDTVNVTIYDNRTITPLGVGRFKNAKLRVAGIFDAGMYEYDNVWALVDLRTAQEMFGLRRAGDADDAGTVSFVEVRVADIYGTEAVMEALRERLGPDYLIMDWKRMNAFFFSALALEKLAMFVTISLIVFVAALNIVATLVLMVMEKNRDIGILLSMGATRRGILYTFIFQGLFIGLMGTVVGLGLGIGASLVADRYQLISLPEQVYYLSHVPFIVRPLDFTVVALMAVA
ncbi:MAG TPA: ABC transporter permease, partial [Acidobacteriota bacterium]